MSDNSTCTNAKDNFRSARSAFDSKKSSKQDLERNISAAGAKVSDQEYSERNKIVNKLRDIEQEINDTKDDSKRNSLNYERNEIVSELRKLEEQIRDTREYIKEKQAEHYQVVSRMNDLRNDMGRFADIVKENCGGNGDWGIDLSIPYID